MILKVMLNIALPKKIDFIKGDKPNQKIITIEPCHPGYGTTLGNSLRRVLLSSLPGAAVVGVKIKGADHEFMALPHVKEDILEIILNLKRLRMKVFTDETVKLELTVHGEKKVTAGEIKKNSQVEIANPELLIAHVTDMAGNLQMEIYVSQGKGYETIENREGEKHETGYIEMDSLFSPVQSVGIDIENVRVGKMTNWDKLILDIVTDGTITPEQAFSLANEILIEQFSALIGKQEIKEDQDRDEDKQTAAESGEVTETKDYEPETAKPVQATNQDADAETAPKKKRGRPRKIKAEEEK